MRLATFNVKHGALGEGYRSNPDLLVEACVELQADILALQEVDRRTVRSRGADLPALIAKETDMKVVFAKTMQFCIGQYGNALLVRGDIDEDTILSMRGGHRFRQKVGERTVRLRHEPRNAIVATAHIGEKAVSIAATHLSPERKYSKQQLPQVLAELACRPEPQVLMGDLNLSRREVLAQLQGSSLTLADSLPTFPASSPKRAIDHIAVNGLTITNSEAILLPVSDHLAFVAEVQ